ncbi:MAG: hypothetical protein C4567_13775 [Deltaproteobacteria bacterium]|nr:MAG: hypothetical protein C4567_13775 [Deltaproteobacteria bacterium]
MNDWVKKNHRRGAEGAEIGGYSITYDPRYNCPKVNLGFYYWDLLRIWHKMPIKKEKMMKLYHLSKRELS